MDTIGAAADGEPPSRADTRTQTSRYVLRLKTARLRSLALGRSSGGTIRAYLGLIPGKARLIPALWLLLSIRHSPVWLFPLLTGRLVDRLRDPATAPSAVAALRWILPATAALCVLNVAATVGASWLLSVQRRSLTAGLRRALLKRIHRLTFAFHDRARAGELANKFLLDMGRIEGLQYYLSELMLLYGTAALIVLAIAGAKDPVLFAVILAAAPANLLLVRLLWNPIRRRSEEFRVAESGFVAFLHEALHGLRLTRAHAVEDYAERRLGTMAGKVAEAGVRADLVGAFFGAASWALSQLLNISVFALCVWRCARGAITLGDVGVFMAYYAMVYGAIAGLVNSLPTVAQAHDAIASLAELYRAENEERDEGKPALATLAGAIELKGIVFGYGDDGRHDLDGVDLSVPAGTSLALVGASGSGKSTIASLILGLYRPGAGQVLVDGRDLAQLDRRSVRRHVGVVSQEVVLFHDTVLGNIAWGDGAPDERRARDAATRANALEFIERLPDGFRTMLGDRGVGLSGGQRQRLAIARALYRDPRLLILDEATSALDPESERQVQRALDELMRGRTTLIIAHRLSTVRNADRIAVLERGRVVEAGTFDELIGRDGPFRRLAQGQLVGADAA